MSHKISGAESVKMCEEVRKKFWYVPYCYSIRIYLKLRDLKFFFLILFKKY